MRRTAALTLLAALPAAVLTGLGVQAATASNAGKAPTQVEAAAAAPTGLRDVMWVGNNWAGTASIVDANTLEVLKRGVNLIPDKEQELADIRTDPERLAFYIAI